MPTLRSLLELVSAFLVTDMVRRRSALMATTDITRTPALLTATTVRPGSLAASSSALALGTTATTAIPTMATATMDVDIMADTDTMAADVTTGARSMGLAEPTAAARSVIHAVSLVAEFIAVPLAASAVERVADSTAVVAAECMPVADTAKNR